MLSPPLGLHLANISSLHLHPSQSLSQTALRKALREEYQGISSTSPPSPSLHPAGCVEMSPLSASQVIYLERCRQSAPYKQLDVERSAQANVFYESLLLWLQPKKKKKTHPAVIKWTIWVLINEVTMAAGMTDVTVLTSVKPGNRWKGRRALGSGEAWVLPSVGRARGGAGLWHTLPERRHSREENTWSKDWIIHFKRWE